jgi:hypothetical protein
MSESRSMPMMGSKLKLEILTPASTGVGATYRYSGRIMGLTLDFSETVTQYILGRVKVWHTISFAYEWPRSLGGRLLGRGFAGSYARWCLDSMAEGAKRDVEASGSKS